MLKEFGSEVFASKSYGQFPLNTKDYVEFDGNPRNFSMTLP
jgi:hypothetical protein